MRGAQQALGAGQYPSHPRGRPRSCEDELQCRVSELAYEHGECIDCLGTGVKSSDHQHCKRCGGTGREPSRSTRWAGRGARHATTQGGRTRSAQTRYAVLRCGRGQAVVLVARRERVKAGA
jgi:hypothetical protein